MHVIGIIAEYNPFHSGHEYHIQEIRQHFGKDACIICVMSGNWVQRGDAAISDKWTRSLAALRGGVDLVLELPTVWAVSSAETFAEGGIFLLSATGLVDTLSFGSEAGTLFPLQKTAEFLSTAEYRVNLRKYLDQGLSFPVARQKAANLLLGGLADCLNMPNNNLGVEYLRAISRLGSAMIPSTILRQGASHDSDASTVSFSSASTLRKKLLSAHNSQLRPYLTEEDTNLLLTSGLATLAYCTRGVFSRLRSMTSEDFLLLPDCGEGLHNRLSEAAQRSNTLEELYQMAKSRRYTHARIRRLVLWAFLGLNASDRPGAPPYLRVLAMNKRGQTLLKQMKHCAEIPIITKAAHAQKLDPIGRHLFELESRCTSLYDLCRADFGKTPGKSEYTSNPMII
jgi:predicted nucleotidyltransferase